MLFSHIFQNQTQKHFLYCQVGFHLQGICFVLQWRGQTQWGTYYNPWYHILGSLTYTGIQFLRHNMTHILYINTFVPHLRKHGGIFIILTWKHQRHLTSPQVQPQWVFLSLSSELPGATLRNTVIFRGNVNFSLLVSGLQLYRYIQSVFYSDREIYFLLRLLWQWGWIAHVRVRVTNVTIQEDAEEHT